MSKELLLVWILGTLGVFSRFAADKVSLKYIPTAFPISTFVVNIVGAFLMGLIVEAGSSRWHLSDEIKTGLTVGFLGGFTTFSSYAFQSLKLFQTAPLMAMIYFVGSPIVCIASAWVGTAVAHRPF